jgi:hypothetical protein
MDDKTHKINLYTIYLAVIYLIMINRKYTPLDIRMAIIKHDLRRLYRNINKQYYDYTALQSFDMLVKGINVTNEV